MNFWKRQALFSPPAVGSLQKAENDVSCHKIGKELADKVLGGRYEYVLTTHIDKGHIHNHIIFCAVDFVTHRKYVSNKKSHYQIRNESDRLCMEHGLSVVTPGQDRGKKYAEWDAERKGTSWKAKLKTVLDDTIPKAKDFDDFLRLMEAAGYEIKRGKNGGKLPDFITLHMGYKELTEKKGKLYQAYGKLKKKVKQYDTIKQNVDSILRQAKQPERERQTESR